MKCDFPSTLIASQTSIFKATKNGTSSPSKKGFQPPKQDPILESSPYMSKILGKIMGKRKGEKSPPDVPKVSFKTRH